MAKVGRKVETPEVQGKKVSPPDQVKPLSPVEQAAHIGSLYRTAGINLSLPNVAVLLRLNNLYAAKGLKATIEDVQMVINTILSDPAFKMDTKQQ